jgi:hypothetical protein
MDDFNTNVLSNAKNEYTSRLLNIITPLVYQGLKSILNEAITLCNDNDENGKYLMTFQNILSRIPKWNQEIIDVETKRIVKTSNCNYLDELITCVHITQLKILTSVRVSSEHKKLDISIPKLNDFIHKIYIETARKIYTNVYLFEDNVLPLVHQKNRRECEIIIRECILNTIRDSIPIDKILRAYLDETREEEVIEETTMMPLSEKEEKDAVNKELAEAREAQEAIDKELAEKQGSQDAIDKELAEKQAREAQEAIDKELAEKQAAQSVIGGGSVGKPVTTDKEVIETPRVSDKSVFPELKEGTTDKLNIQFNNLDNVVKFNKGESPDQIKKSRVDTITAPKTIERLEKLSHDRFRKRQEDDEEEDEDGDDEEEDEVKLQIFKDDSSIKINDIEVLDDPLILKKNVLQFEELT